MKRWWLVLAVMCLCLSPGVEAAVQISDYLTNATFDVAWTGSDDGVSSLYSPMGDQPAATHGWQCWADATGGGYYIDSYANVEDTSPSMAYMQLHAGAGDIRMWQDVGCDLAAGETYQVAFKYRQFSQGTDIRDTADLDVFWGLYDGSMHDVVSISKATIDSTWQTYSYSFTYDGSQGETIAANSWVLAFRVTNGTSGVPSGVTIDSLASVPEPMTMGLLAFGWLLVRRRR